MLYERHLVLFVEILMLHLLNEFAFGGICRDDPKKTNSGMLF